MYDTSFVNMVGHKAVLMQSCASLVNKHKNYLCICIQNVMSMTDEWS